MELTKEHFAILEHTQMNGLFCGDSQEIRDLCSLKMMKCVGKKSFVPEPYFELTRDGKSAIADFREVSGKNNKMVIPFSNGTDFMIWRGSNCDICTKDCPCTEDGFFGEPLCDIEEALAFGSVSKGEITIELAKRAGYSDDVMPEKCNEFVGS